MTKRMKERSLSLDRQIEKIYALYERTLEALDNEKLSMSDMPRRLGADYKLLREHIKNMQNLTYVSGFWYGFTLGEKNALLKETPQK